LRFKNGSKYHINPFRDLAIPIRRKKGGLVLKANAPSPGRKILRLKELAEAVNLSDVGKALEGIYDNEIRNAVYHSDYTLTDDEFRMLSGRRLSRKGNYFSQVADWAELSELFSECFAFYQAVFALYDRCRKSFGDFDGALIPYDAHYKALLQLLFDEDKALIGFRTYWPNGTLGEYCRTRKGAVGVNLVFDPDGSINFMVGIYASRPGRFSPLVEEGSETLYAEVPGVGIRPHWPSNLRAYKLAKA
jgi:hypothetical protein